MVARTDRGLLLTCLWYIRVVKPGHLVVYGPHHDGVYVIEKGRGGGGGQQLPLQRRSPVDLLSTGYRGRHLCALTRAGVRRVPEPDDHAAPAHPRLQHELGGQAAAEWPQTGLCGRTAAPVVHDGGLVPQGRGAPRRGAAAPWRTKGPCFSIRSWEPAELGVVRRKREVGDCPGHLAKEVHHGARHNEEGDARPRTSLQVDDLEPRRLGRPAGAWCAAALVDRLRPHHELGELAIGAHADLLRKVRPARTQRPGDLSPTATTTGWRLTTRSNEASPKGQAGCVRRATTRARSGCKRVRATTTLGHHPRSPPGTAGASPWRAPRAARLDIQCGPGAGHGPPSTARSPRAVAPRWPGPRTRRSPTPRRVLPRPRRRAARTTSRGVGAAGRRSRLSAARSQRSVGVSTTT